MRLPFRTRVEILLKVKRIGYYAARQHCLKRGGNEFDVAWILTSHLRMISGVK